MQNGTDIYSRAAPAKVVPEKKGLLDEMEDLERKRSAKKAAKAGEKEKGKDAKSDLDLDKIW